jgi:endonuclease-3 related protein
VKNRASGRTSAIERAVKRPSPGAPPVTRSSKGSFLLRIYHALLETYGPQGWWPVGGRYFPRESEGFEQRREQRFEVILGAVLTQNTSWKNAEKALRNLRERGLVDPGRILHTPTVELSALLRPSGYHNQKALKVKRASAFAAYCFRRGRAPSREELLRVKGVGFETADSILLYAFGEPFFVVDAYTRRLCARLGLAGEKATYAELQALFTASLPADSALYNEYHALIVRHAKERCAKTPLCAACVLKKKRLCQHPSRGSAGMRYARRPAP